MTRFPAPWAVERIAGGFKVIDANGQSLAYVYAGDTESDAIIPKVLTEDESKAYSEQHRQATEVIATQISAAPPIPNEKD